MIDPYASTTPGGHVVSIAREEMPRGLEVPVKRPGRTASRELARRAQTIVQR